MVFKIAKKSPKCLAVFDGNFVTKNFQKLPYLVTLRASMTNKVLPII